MGPQPRVLTMHPSLSLPAETRIHPSPPHGNSGPRLPEFLSLIIPSRPEFPSLEPYSPTAHSSLFIPPIAPPSPDSPHRTLTPSQLSPSLPPSFSRNSSPSPQFPILPHSAFPLLSASYQHYPSRGIRPPPRSSTVRGLRPRAEINIIFTRDRTPPHRTHEFALSRGRTLPHARLSSPSYPAEFTSARSSLHPHRPCRSLLFPSSRFLFRAARIHESVKEREFVTTGAPRPAQMCRLRPFLVVAPAPQADLLPRQDQPSTARIGLAPHRCLASVPRAPRAPATRASSHIRT